ncbi:MAG: DNA methyltransferase [Minisyncoccota bacterium]
MRKTGQTKKVHKSPDREKELKRLYSNPISSTRSGALFNAFSYPTKISPEAIALFIATHTSPGAVVLDTFGGSGTTGLAALLCDQPTEAMERTASELHLKPQWGPRKAVIYEIGTLGAFISRTMCRPNDPKKFEAIAKKMIDRVESETKDLYSAIDPNGEVGQIRHVIWSDVLSCPSCQKESTYWDAVVNTSPLKLRSYFYCSHCKNKSPLDFAKRVTENFFDPLLNQTIVRKKRLPATIYGQTDGKNWCRPATADDKKRYEKIIKRSLSAKPLIKPIVWGDLYRGGYHTGITHLHHFYTYRNFLAMTALWKAIEDEPLEFRDALRLLVLSYNATHSTLMTRVVIKKGQKDFALTGAQSGVLYISSLPVEKNIFQGLRRKVRTLTQAFTITFGSRSEVDVRQASSTKIDLPNESVDYVFTDPPFGDYIPYAEINQINEIWLGRTTDRSKEIIVSHAQGKSVGQYGALMRSVLSEIARTLKKRGKATLVFHSSKAEVWQALTDAYQFAGFGVKTTSVLDKIQESFKQVVSTISVKGDPLLLLEKRSTKVSKKNQDVTREKIIAGVVNKIWAEKKDIKELSPERMYSRFIGECLEEGISVELGAEAFYKMVQHKKNA